MTQVRYIVRCLEGNSPEDFPYESKRYSNREDAERHLASVISFGACSHEHAVVEVFKLDMGKWVDVVPVKVTRAEPIPAQFSGRWIDPR